MTEKKKLSEKMRGALVSDEQLWLTPQEPNGFTRVLYGEWDEAKLGFTGEEAALVPLAREAHEKGLWPEDYSGAPTIHGGNVVTAVGLTAMGSFVVFAFLGLMGMMLHLAADFNRPLILAASAVLTALVTALSLWMRHATRGASRERRARDKRLGEGLQRLGAWKLNGPKRDSYGDLDRRVDSFYSKSLPRKLQEERRHLLLTIAEVRRDSRKDFLAPEARAALERECKRLMDADDTLMAEALKPKLSEASKRALLELNYRQLPPGEVTEGVFHGYPHGGALAGGLPEAVLEGVPLLASAPGASK